MLFISFSLQVFLFAVVYLAATCAILVLSHPIDTAMEDSLQGCGYGGGGFQLSGGCGCGQRLPPPY